MSQIQKTAAIVETFMDKNVSGWIRENEIVDLLDHSVTLHDIFECVAKLRNPNELDVIVRFLENAVRHEPIASRVVDTSHRMYLLEALMSPSERLRGVVLEAVSNSSTSLPVDVELSIRLLCDPDTGISQRAIRYIVSRIPKNPTIIQSLIHHYKTNELSEIEKFRFIETFINIGRSSKDHFAEIRSSGSFDPIILSFLSNDSDLLVKLSSLTLIESLASYESGREYLGSSGILLQLERELSGPLADSTTVISLMYTMSCIIPFVARSQPDQVRFILLSQSSKFQTVLNDFITSVVNAERMCAYKVLGGLAAGASVSEPVETFLRKNWKLFQQVQYAVLDIDVEVVNTAIDTLHSLIKSWERNPYMESEPAQASLMETIMETFRRHPFPECRCLVYALLGAMLSVEELAVSALAKLLTDPSPIRAALLDHKSESNYDSRRAKCDFVRVLVKMEEKNLLRRFFTKEEVENFCDFAQQGLAWVPITESKSEMETEAV